MNRNNDILKIFIFVTITNFREETSFANRYCQFTSRSLYYLCVSFPALCSAFAFYAIVAACQREKDKISLNWRDKIIMKKQIFCNDLKEKEMNIRTS
uniref:Uncharacterized protein LOC111108644 isoform X2 n=1 Tax=Crassostrea virginica TaxID=6565 RepID=A0A8B8BAA8_CRAVI|nr:uncharacterized protein LOC111108644 isoform X2 [Crassostrea virginica]